MGEQRVEWRVVGDVGASVDGRPIDVRGRRPLDALAYLLLHRGERVTTDRLVNELWHNDPPASARNTTQRFVGDLRRALGSAGSRISTTDDGYRLRLGPDDSFDLDELDTALREARLQGGAGESGDAATLLDRFLDESTGSVMGGVSDLEFVESARRQISALVVEARELRIECRLRQGEFRRAALDAESLVADHPYHEGLWAKLMTALYLDGDQRGALESYQRLRTNLVDDVGVEPSPPLRDLERRILNHDMVTPGSPQPEPPAPTTTTATTAPKSAPTVSERLYGRDAELHLITELLSSGESRLLSIVGPGGSGKTRLSLAIAEALTPGAGEIYFASLDGVADTDRVAFAIGAACGIDIADSAGSVAELANGLGDRDVLVVVDNAEHVVDTAASLLADLLDLTGSVRFLVTSRVVLGLAAERVVRLDGLTVSSAFATESDSPAVAMFIDRATKVDHSFVADGHVPEICRAVGGSPLAIELAARWVSALTPAEILDSVRRGPELLESDLRDLPERHRSMRRVLEASWETLSSEEQSTMAAVSVFRGGFDSAAAKGVAGADPMTLRHFIDRSLLSRRADGRYEVHELVRQFAALMVDQSPGLRDELQAKHAHHFLRRTAEAWRDLVGVDAGPTTTALVADIDNLAVAWRWAVEHGEIDRLAAAAEALAHLAMSACRVAEGVELLELATTIGPAAFRAELIGHQLMLTWAEAPFSKSEERFARGLQMVPGTTPAELRTRALLEAGFGQAVAESSGNTAESRQLFDQAFEHLVGLDDPDLEATVRVAAAKTETASGRFDRAAELLRPAVEHFVASGNVAGEAEAWSRMAMVFAEQYRLGPALEADVKALELFLQLGNRGRSSVSYLNVGASYVLVGAWAEAMRATELAIETMDPSRGNLDGYIDCQLAEIYAGAGDRAKAEELFTKGIAAPRNTRSRCASSCPCGVASCSRKDATARPSSYSTRPGRPGKRQTVNTSCLLSTPSEPATCWLSAGAKKHYSWQPTPGRPSTSAAAMDCRFRSSQRSTACWCSRAWATWPPPAQPHFSHVRWCELS